jgi:hypothetical protein
MTKMLATTADVTITAMIRTKTTSDISDKPPSNVGPAQIMHAAFHCLYQAIPILAAGYG